MENEADFAAAASWYARHGFPVFPVHSVFHGQCSCNSSDCEHPGKHPRTIHGFKDASKDSAQIEVWWRQWPTANIGLPTGAVSGLFVLDIDPRNGGDESIEILVAKYGPLPETAEQLTGGGGRHIVLRHPRVSVPKTLAPGIDLKGDGGYFIVAPSIHLSGQRYLWDGLAGMEALINVADAPPWLLKIIADARRRRNEEIAPEARKWVRGERNDRLMSLAGTMRRRGMTRESIFAALQVENQQHADPPLSEDEVARIAESVCRYSAGPRNDQRSKEGIEPFPIEALPGPLAGFVQEASDALPCSPDLVAVPMLVALGAAIGTRRALRIKPNWIEGPRIYAAVVNNPGTKKSPALSLVLKPLFDAQKRFQSEYEEAMRAFHQTRARREAETCGIENRRIPGDAENHKKVQTQGSTERNGNAIEPQVLRGPPLPSKEPFMTQTSTTDATLESLAVLLHQNPLGILFVRDELAGWVRSMNQYRNGKGADRQSWLSFWSGAEVIVNRKGSKDPIILHSPFVNVVGCMPPDALADLSAERGQQDGFIHRLLFSYPDSITGGWTDHYLSEAALDGYVNVYNKLSALSPAGDEYGFGTPRIVSFTPTGRETFVKFVGVHFAELEDPLFPDHLCGPWLKMEGYCARLALILHECRYVTGEAETEDVDRISVLGAAALIDYFKSHTRRVHERLGVTEQDKRVETALKWIRKQGGSVTMREILTYKVAGCKNKSEAELLFRELGDRGLGMCKTTQPKRGGQRTVRFELE